MDKVTICPSVVESAAPRVPMRKTSTKKMFRAISHRLPTTDSDAGLAGLLVVRTAAKDFFYRRYQGFNTLVVKI